MADTRVVLPACPCPMRARLRRLAPSYTFTGCLLPQAYGKGDTARNEDEYTVQASPTTPAKLLMLTQGMGRLKGREQASQSRHKCPASSPVITSQIRRAQPMWHMGIAPFIREESQ